MGPSGSDSASNIGIGAPVLALGLSFEDGAIDKRKITPFLRIERLKKPTRYVLNLRYAFEDQKRDPIICYNQRRICGIYIWGI